MSRNLDAGARVEIRTVGRGTQAFQRVYLYCPDGHEVVSAPARMRTGRLILAGDYSREFCGHGGCNWHRHLWDPSWANQ